MLSNLYIIILLLCTFSIVLFILLNRENKEAPEALDNEKNKSLNYELESVLSQVNAMARTETERQARYKDLKNKYRNAFEVLGQQFPQYEQFN